MTPGCVKIHVSSCNKHTRELFCDKCHRCALHHLLVQGEHETQCHGPDQPSSPDKPSGILLGDSQVKDFDFCVPFDWAQWKRWFNPLLNYQRFFEMFTIKCFFLIPPGGHRGLVCSCSEWWGRMASINKWWPSHRRTACSIASVFVLSFSFWRWPGHSRSELSERCLCVHPRDTHPQCTPPLPPCSFAPPNHPCHRL